MYSPFYTIHYVKNPQASAALYQELLKIEPIEASPNFALIQINEMCRLGFWALDDIPYMEKQASQANPVEIALPLENIEAVEKLHHDCIHLDMPIIQPPVQMDFGYTFLTQDRDGHFLRIFCKS